MNSPALFPAPDAIPVPWGWFEALLLVTFVLHLLFMNTMVGSAIIAFIEHARGGGKDAHRESLRDTSVRLPYVIAFAVNLGVPPLLFFSVLWGNVGYVTTTLMAVWWLSIIAVLILAYYGAYLYKYRFDKLGARGAVLIGFVALSLLFVGFLFVNNFSMMLNPGAWQAYFENPSGTLLNLGDATLWPRYLHFVAASIAVGGLFRALVWRRREEAGDAAAGERVKAGMRWFFWATLVQVVVGIWYLLAQPTAVRGLFLGGSLAHTGLLSLGLMLALSMLVMAHRRKVILVTFHLVATIGVMAVVRELVRFASLEEGFSPARLEVVPQYSPMILFLVAFAVGIALVVYMLKIVRSAARDGGEG